MKKEEVYVNVRTAAQVKEIKVILEKFNEPTFDGVKIEEYSTWGYGFCTDIDAWQGINTRATKYSNRKLVTAEELEDILLLEKAYRDYPIGTKFKSIEINDKEMIRTIKPYGGKQTVTFGISKDSYRENCKAVRCNNGINTNDGGRSNPVIYSDGKWAEIIKEEKVMKFKEANLIQSITRAKLGDIVEVACSNWKKKLTTYANRNLFADTIELTDDEVKEMFEASSVSQKEVLIKSGLTLPVEDLSVDLSGLIGEFITDEHNTIWVGDRVAKDQGLHHKCFGLDEAYIWTLGLADNGKNQILIPTKREESEELPW